ncbi:MAG: ATP-dependent DNA helicase RecG [Candidatus Bipolaricaulota bacterium]|nr:ATP-dependent DNA helicase RecG [Candidatus Bipolaricaulota bacterium]
MGESKKEKFKKILKLEKRKGFKDNAVMGGLESLTPGLVEDEEIQELLEGYSEKKPFARQGIVEDIENLLETGEDGDPRDLSLDQPIEDAVGVGNKRGKKFSSLGIETIRDLLFHFPRRIEDRRIEKDISEVKNGDSCTVVGEVKGLTKLKPRRKVELVKAEIRDGTGTIYPVWFNQPWIKNQLNQETEIAIYGEVKREYGEIQMENPVWEPRDEKEKTRKLVPIYPGTENLSQKVIRWVVRRNLEKFLPAVKQFPDLSTTEKHGFWGRRTALRKIHIPKKPEDFERARKSLSFSELFLFYVRMMDKTDSESEETPRLSVEEGELDEFRENLPFSLTEDQENVLEEILTELEAPVPMNRLLQGDVGTGKTVVAAAAGYVVGTSGFQTAMMAPTTVLAEQHFRNLENLFFDLPVDVELLTGDTPKGKREEILSRLKSGEIDILVGTHALLEETVTFNALNLVIIDEEQRFGVAQKEQLGWAEAPVNKLVLSATPIPRTITATVYGEFEVSRLEEFPRGEKNVKTYWVSESKRDQVYEYVKDKMSEGSQAFIVLPLIEESDNQDLRSAVETHKELSENQLKGFNLGLLHGRMSQEEKGKKIEKFERGKFGGLVSTTVIEVGVDIPQARLLVVEEADQFGLTQLHQLRGRIGRSGDKSYCFAIGSPSTSEGRERLEAFRDISNGFELVEKDLEIRGPGDLLSSAQHGFRNSFRACNFLRDYDIMTKAREEAGRFLDNGYDESLEEIFENYFAGGFDRLESD